MSARHGTAYSDRKLRVLCVQRTPDYTKIGRDVLHWALCLPASCRPAELQRVLDHELEGLAKKLGLSVSAKVSPELCSIAADPLPYTPAEIAFSAQAPLAARVFLCFSARRSVKSVLRTRVNLPALDCSNGPRVLFMILIMFGHRLIMYVGHPVDDATKLDYLFRDLGNIFIVNGTLLVDSYLVVSGFLLAYQLLENLDKHKKANLVQGLLLRYIR
ncbi:hypothetical protein PR048_006936 [Dryococelus australis]|uniref:Uncharacterized protein n=1 Tax=Dryococelus australis TaxID=614101 RepID=A0ABQ9ICE6_9NEOP|nr:hypothetical protein PR048_006936 [Dryococelus australis]